MNQITQALDKTVFTEQQLDRDEGAVGSVLAPKAEGWVFETQPQQTLDVKTGSDSSTAKCSAIGVSVTSPWR